MKFMMIWLSLFLFCGSVLREEKPPKPTNKRNYNLFGFLKILLQFLYFFALVWSQDGR
eukprot:TRINITY_DN6878_c0_g1_i1.p1 TRINITY_DN6878_c0_g1~~TRINITY_DN6878_c0_g1_i1.p1  ORF type:complete len:58 (+),score=5.82 TRINITY_DN6878_c0_g1_i1:303-476(+)